MNKPSATRLIEEILLKLRPLSARIEYNKLILKFGRIIQWFIEG